MLVKTAAIFQPPPFCLVFCTPSHRADQETPAWEHGNTARGCRHNGPPDFTHVHGSTMLVQSDTNTHSVTPPPHVPPALSSPAAITLSRHKKTAAKMNTISTSTLAWGCVRGNTSPVFQPDSVHKATPAFTVSPALGSGAHTVNPTA